MSGLIWVCCRGPVNGTSESIHRPAQAGGAAGILGHLHARIDQDLPDGFAPPAQRLQVAHDLRRGRDAEGIDHDSFVLQQPGEFEEVAGLAAGAGADIGAVEFDVAHFFGFFALARIRMAGDGRFQF